MFASFFVYIDGRRFLNSSQLRFEDSVVPVILMCFETIGIDRAVYESCLH